jgi:hypothetical protein
MIFLALVVAASGCGGGPRTVPVSGQVKLNGEPLGDAHVIFQPDSQEKHPGPPSFGKTDAQGRFVLRTADGHDGAVVGPHKVRISLPVQATSASPDAPPGNKLPTRYSGESSVLKFTVPAGGTSEANFLDLTSQ